MHEVLRLNALMGKQAGCRKVADTFNQLHVPTRVGKSFVSNTIRNHQYPLLNISRELRNKCPAPTSVNSIWGVDLTFVRDHCGTPRSVLGVVNHGSRICTRLAAIVNYVHTHQNLAGLTPAEAWAGITPIDLAQTPPKSTQLVHALDGLLESNYIRR